MANSTTLMDSHAHIFITDFFHLLDILTLESNKKHWDKEGDA